MEVCIVYDIYYLQVERVKAVKIAQIKEQQGKQCPVCYSTAIQHRFTFSLVLIHDLDPDLRDR